MKKEILQVTVEEEKQTIRNEFLKRRKAIPQERREEAQKALFSELLNETLHHHFVLSFAAKDDEISLWQLNLHLCAHGQLILPKVNGVHLDLYQVNDIENELEIGRFQLLEPKSTICRKIEIEEIDLVLVPAIVFDAKGHRLGYGKGYYDRLLASTHATMKIGVGFKEQLYEKTLPQEPTDISVNFLKLY